MRTLILYFSKYGFTKRVANMLADHFEGDVVVEKCTKDYCVDLTKFDNIILGSPIYVGRPNVDLLDFCDSYQRLLMNKRLGVFVTGFTKEDALTSLMKSMPDGVYKHAKARAYFGYELNFEKMSFLDRLATRIVTRKAQSETVIKAHSIEAFAQKFES